MRFLSDPLLSLRIVLFAGMVPWLLRLPVRRLERWLEPKRPHRHVASLESHQVIDLVERLFRLARPFISHPCQVRGLTLYYFLRRAGEDVSLVFGIGKIEGAYHGHCWLVKDGQPYLEMTDPRSLFTVMHAFNAHPSGPVYSATGNAVTRHA